MTKYGPIPPSRVEYDVNGDGLFTSSIGISGGAGSPISLGGVPNGNIIIPPGGNVNVLLSVGNANYAVVPGASGTINFGVNLLSTNTVYVGGTATINTTATALSTLVLNVTGGNATLGSGFLAGALGGSIINLTDGGTFSNSTTLISALNGSTINYGPGGGTFIANAGGAVLDLSRTTINGFAAGNNGLNHLEFTNLPATPAATYTITNNADGTQTITVLDGSNNPIVTSTIAGQSLPAGIYTPGQPGPLTLTGDGTTTITITDLAVPCFLAGTRIRTAKGEVAIEDIRVGDEVIALVDGRDEVRAVTWIGTGSVYARAKASSDEGGYPVRVLRDAISEGVPYKDLLVTSEHCFFFGGTLTPIRMLVNGRSIFYDRSIPSCTYHHIECAEHAIVYADGMLAETYLDTGNRRNFGEQSNVVRLPTTRKDWARDAAAPLCVDRAVVEPLFRTIEARAIQRNVSEKAEPRRRTDDADLHLVTQGGRIIRQARSVDGVAIFMIPSNVGSVRIVSRTSRPADTIGPFVDDRRHLGVLIGAITLSEGGSSREITEHLTAAKLRGWDWQEATPCRWTNGNAVLSLGERAPNAIAVLGLQILSAGPYLIETSIFEDAVLNG